MGFFSGISKIAGGLGGAATSSSQGSSQSGFALLPEEIQSAYKGYAPLLKQFLDPTNAANVDRFKPLGQTSYEDTALSAIGQGFTPDAAQLQSDIEMQMNPFDDYVIDEINRQGTGENSLLRGAMDEAGQYGSNRGILGANDIDLTRMNLIGRFKQDQYNTALDNSLNTLAKSRAGDATMQMGAGEFLRGLDMDTKQAPINSLTTFGKLLGVLPTNGGSTATNSSESQGETGGLGGVLKTAGTVASIASMFSDERLKENVTEAGERNGFKLYDFNYIGEPETRYRGVMAQDVLETMPDAVSEINGYLAVDYGQLGFEMERI